MGIPFDSNASRIPVQCITGQVGRWLTSGSSLGWFRRGLAFEGEKVSQWKDGVMKILLDSSDNPPDEIRELIDPVQAVISLEICRRVRDGFVSPGDWVGDVDCGSTALDDGQDVRFE